jgi:hypothetical protein
MLVVNLGGGSPTCNGLGARDPAVTGQLMACPSLKIERLHRTVVAHLQPVEVLVHGTGRNVLVGSWV